MNRGSKDGQPVRVAAQIASMRPRFMNRGSRVAEMRRPHLQ